MFESQSFIQTSNRNKCPGLRDYVPSPPCYVYELKPDGSKGKLLRIEQAKIYEPQTNITTRLI